MLQQKKCLRPAVIAALMVALSLTASGCFRGGGGIGFLGDVILTAAVISTIPPPPARVVYAPKSRSGYMWQPGYWVPEGQRWIWVEGRWVAVPPGYVWSPAHWEQDPAGSWRLAPGQWIPAGR